MILELTGAGIVILAALFLSTGLIRDYKANLRELEALYDMISYIRDNIEHLMKPLPDIFRTYTNDYLETCGFLPAVRKTDLRQAWANHRFSVAGEAHTLIEDFIETVGSGYRTEELRLCEYTLTRLSGIIEKSRAESANKIRLYKTVPMMLALSVILILI